jgi:hypothetical protein
MPDTSWYPGNYVPDPAYPPHYSTMPEYLRVVDAGLPQLTGKRAAFWLRCRDSGLAEWAPTGLKIKLPLDAEAYGAQRVTFNLADPQVGDLPAAHCFEVCPPLTKSGSGWLHVDPDSFEQYFLARNTARLKYLFAHEFGHALGFGHGGDGIMDQTPEHAVVNDEEIAAVRAYWGLA